MDIANVLKYLRTDSGMTQKELSERLDIAQATIACYENGQRVPHISALVAYADFFDCSLDCIVGRCDEFGNRKARPNRTYAPNDEERELLNKFKNLTKEQRAMLKGYIDGLKSIKK